MIPPPACPPPKGGGISFEIKERAKRHQCRARFKRVVGMIPPPPLKERKILNQSALLFLKEILALHRSMPVMKREKMEVVG